MIKLAKKALGHLVSCQDVAQQLSRMRDEPLSRWARTKLRWHVSVCGMCEAFENQLRFLQEAMRRYRE